MISEERIYRKSPIWLQHAFMNGHALRIHRQRYGRDFEELEEKWEKSQWWAPDELHALQDQKIRKIIHHAYNNVPFYRWRFDFAGVLPSDIKGVADLTKLPILTKDDIRSAGNSLFSNGSHANLIQGHTSGTTGSPLSIFYDRTMCIANNVADWRQKKWGGMTHDQWCGMFLGRVIVPTTQTAPPFWRSNHIQKQLWFSTFHMNDQTLASYVAEIRKRGIQFLEGYPSTLFILARFLERKGERLPLTAVFTSSETLHNIQRDTLHAAFGCPIYDFYGLAERVLFAGECEMHDGKHIFDEYGTVEIVDDSGQPVPDGKSGWLTATTLWNYGMPLIRYKTNDMATKLTTKCGCGRGLSRMSAVTTKAEDVVITPDGRYLSPSVLTHPFKPFPQIVKSQIIQNTPDEITVKIVPSTEFLPAHQAELVSGLQERLSPTMRIGVEIVSDIPSEQSGKFRWVISRVPHSCTVSW